MAEPISASEQGRTPELPQVRAETTLTRAERIRAIRGKYAWIPFSSDDHVREKQEELEREEREQEKR
ncbi:MAG: hypothetical protein WCB27_13350 [Thermoguttaceae bacterium]|jgi:hypothetical protein